MPFELLAAARELIAIDSRSSLSDGPVVELLAPLCRAAGLDVEVYCERRGGVEQFDLLAFRGRPTADGVLLVTHLDTVPPGDPALWTACEGRPFAAVEREGELHGLGSADVKIDFLCKLAAMERLRDERLLRPLVLAGTYGEEVGRYGATLLVERLRPLPAIAFVGEPTGLRPCVAHKGYAELHVHGRTTHSVPLPDGSCWELRFKGVGAHSSQTNRGRSATDACLSALQALLEGDECAVVSLEGGDVVNKVAAAAHAVVVCRRRPAAPGAAHIAPVERPVAAVWSPGLVAALLDVYRSTATLRADLERVSAPGFDPPFSTVNNGLLRLDVSGFSHVSDVRRLPGEAPERALGAHIERLAGLAAGGLCALDVERRLDSPPFATPNESAARAALEAALAARGLPLEPERKSGTTEATVCAGAGMDTVIFGPGETAGNIHTPNEHVPLTHLAQAVDIYADVLRSLCAF